MPPNIITSIIESSTQLRTNQATSSSLHQINRSPSQVQLTSSSVHVTKKSISSSFTTRSQPNSNVMIITQSLSSQTLTTQSSVVTSKTSLTSSAILEDPTLFFSGGSRNEGQFTVTIICIAIVMAVVILSSSLLGMAVLIRCKRHKKIRTEKEITSCNGSKCLDYAYIHISFLNCVISLSIYINSYYRLQ